MTGHDDFLKLVKRMGRYGSEGEASRAVNAVFGTIKSWLPPSASDLMRKALPQDASRLWMFSPLAFLPPGIRPDSNDKASDHFVLHIQQAGRYRSSGEATRAARSVVNALAGCLPRDSARFLARIFPEELLEICRTTEPGWAA